MKCLATALLVACFAVSAAAGTRRARPKLVNGQIVISGPAFEARPAVVVKDLRFYACTLEKTGAGCTVITGAIVSSLSTANYKVTVAVALYGVDTTWPGDSIDGTVEATILHPKPGKRVKFVMLGPPCCKPDHDGARKYAAHTVSVAVKYHTPRDGMAVAQP